MVKADQQLAVILEAQKSEACISLSGREPAETHAAAIPGPCVGPGGVSTNAWTASRPPNGPSIQKSIVSRP